MPAAAAPGAAPEGGSQQPPSPPPPLRSLWLPRRQGGELTSLGAGARVKKVALMSVKVRALQAAPHGISPCRAGPNAPSPLRPHLLTPCARALCQVYAVTLYVDAPTAAAAAPKSEAAALDALQVGGGACQRGPLPRLYACVRLAPADTLRLLAGPPCRAERRLH